MEEIQNDPAEYPKPILMKFVGRNPQDVPLSEDEHYTLHAWLHASDENQRLFDMIVAGEPILDRLATVMNARDKGWKQLQEQITPVRRLRPAVRWVAAAAFLGVIVLTAVLHTRRSDHDSGMAQVPVSPGKDVATLTLSNGQQVQLGSNGGIVAYQGGLTVANDTSGELSYLGKENVSFATTYNTLRTPRGGQYRLVLPDGSKVWLNAQSSIRYPASFSASSRAVIIEGEAYFEIAKDASRPFQVEVVTPTGNMQVAVLGTHFNVNAYAERGTIKTTLLEGAVRIKKGAQTSQLQPGQQSNVAWNTDEITTQRIENVDDAVAWKEGYMSFYGQQLGDLANDIARWYDLELDMEPGHANTTVITVAHRDMPLDSLISFLQQADLKVRRQGKTLIIGK